MAAVEEAVPCDVLTAALYARFRSRQDHTFAKKMLSAMRKSSAATWSGAPATNASKHRERLTQPRDNNGQNSEGCGGAPRVGQPADPCVMVIFGASGDLTHASSFPRSTTSPKPICCPPISLSSGWRAVAVHNEDFRKKTRRRHTRIRGSPKSTHDLWIGSPERIYYITGDFKDSGRYHQN